MQVIALFLIGVLAGILSGIFGIGGGIILVPALVFIMGYSQVMANGTSLVALLLPVGILGVLEYYKGGKITGDNIKLGLLIAVGLFLGTYFGAKLAVDMPIRLLSRIFAVFLIAVAVKLLWENR